MSVHLMRADDHCDDMGLIYMIDLRLGGGVWSPSVLPSLVNGRRRSQRRPAARHRDDVEGKRGMRTGV